MLTDSQNPFTVRLSKKFATKSHLHNPPHLQAWRKVMAAYRRVYDSRHLQAYCQEPGSAPELYAR